LQVCIFLDLVAPTITFPSNVALAANSVCNATNFSFNSPSTTEIYTLSLHDALPISVFALGTNIVTWTVTDSSGNTATCQQQVIRSEEHTPELQSLAYLVCRLLPENNTTNVNLGTPLTSDNCGVATVTNNAPATFALG